ncbi:MAG: RNA polymerase sporulation sigma factor SigF [Lachnospiraceae bacterium]|nr:RNA polymerase sporulation sigma factor SigF [Lachnospiraceae bacterium]
MDIKELIKKAGEGDALAKEQIVTENSGLVWSIVRKFRGRGYEMQDLYQIGVIGLLKCIDKFDLSYDVKFSTYAVPMIMGEIKRFLRDDGMIKVSRTLKETAVKANYLREELTQKNGCEPSIGELAFACGISGEELVMAMDAGKEVESIYKTIYQSDGNSVYLLDKLSENETENENMVDLITLREELSSLDVKERQIIIMRYFEDKTQTETAKRLGISQVQVSRIERRVIDKIRGKMLNL